MALATADEVYDLLILVDATSSMTRYLASLRQSLPQILSISGLTDCFQQIGVMAYRDYCDARLLEWSGWRGPNVPGKSEADLITIASKIEAIGGGDYPEAAKTGLAKAYQVMREDAKTLILFYADAPPHMHGDRDNGYSNGLKEKENLKNTDKYGGHGAKFVDWVSAAKTLRYGPKRAHFMGLLSSACTGTGVYEYMAAMTDGACVSVRTQDPREISEMTVEVLLAWMGVQKAGAASINHHAALHQYKDLSGLTAIGRETDSRARKFFTLGGPMLEPRVVTRINLSTLDLQQHLPKKPTPVQDFAKTYKESEAYRTMVVKHLKEIIDRNVSAISLNPVFGSLWRTFCNDRGHPDRQSLIDLFGRRVDEISALDERQHMKTWLEESYDYTAEVMSLIESVPEAERFPCVCLDPTLAFESAQDGEDESSKPITEFRRDELLEIGRSCDYRILRRLGRVLTRLTFIDSAETMPAHIAATTDAELPKIPLVLATATYKREFWRILLHIVVPGTMLSARPAAVLAALSIRLGIRPLFDAAAKEMLRWKKRWNNVEVPETWNAGCLTLLLDADSAYRTHGGAGSNAELLLDKDRQLFQTLVDYKLLEANLNTDLTARVGWTPEKTSLPIGPLVMCRSCKLPRSVTIMGPSKMCGLCLKDWTDKAEEIERKKTNVTVSDNECTTAYWYECFVQTCRAQYVVYNVQQLNVRPKCYYCRSEEKAPTVQCSSCLSRMVWPEQYRRNNIDYNDWTCIACRSTRATIVNVDTTANKLREENGNDWLVRNSQSKIKTLFNGRSLFHLASTASPLDNFTDRVEVLPNRGGNGDLRLCIRGKLVRNPQDILDQLHGWIARRRTEQGTCSLCFGDFKKSDLIAACGRSGCAQRICQTCASGWYGLNGRGKILNVAAVCCPFCRRFPTNKILMRYGMGINTVADLAVAIANKGEWHYAWCADCDHARQYVERVCAQATPEIERWACDTCVRRVTKDFDKTNPTKPCPGCGIPSQKISGCDHVQCTVSQCGVHWCFFCGKKQDEATIYGHMATHVRGSGGDGPFWSDDESD